MTTALLEPPTRYYSSEVANLVWEAVSRHLSVDVRGRVRIGMTFQIPLPNDRTRNSRPDIAIVLYDRWAKNRPLSLTGNAIDVVPNIAVEVISPTDLAEAVTVKAMEYLDGGVQLVWQIFPEARVLFAHRPNGQPPGYASHCTRPRDILPGFRATLGELLPEVAAE